MSKRIHFYFWLTSTLILFYHIKFPNGHLSFHNLALNYGNQTQNLDKRNILILIIICYLYWVGILYLFAEKFGIELKKVIKQIHVYTTLGKMWLIIVLVVYSFYFPNKFIRLIHNSKFEVVINTFGLIMLIVQIIFLVSFIVELIRRKHSLKFI